jgi:hypothetical protein
VRNTVLATAVAAVLTLSAADASAQSKGAASRAEIEAIQTQMKALIERVNRLEATNTQLQTENAELKTTVERRDAETDYLKEQTKDLRAQAANATNELSKVKGTDWAKNVKVKGDLRYRHEMFNRDDKDEDRHRERIRARIGVEAKVTDTILVGMQLATGGEDPRSSNQTLGSADTRKTIGLDLAYADWKFAEGANLVLGKQKWPFLRPGQSLFYDGDFNPEGAAINFNRGAFFATAWGAWLSEADQANDGDIWGAQAGFRLPFGSQSNVASLGYYDLDDADGRSVIWPRARSLAAASTATRRPVRPAADPGIRLQGPEGRREHGDRKAAAAGVHRLREERRSEGSQQTYSVGFLIGKASNDRTGSSEPPTRASTRMRCSVSSSTRTLATARPTRRDGSFDSATCRSRTGG